MNKHRWAPGTLWTIALNVVLWESCFCIQIVNQPKSHISVVESESIRLDCRYDTRVHCVWFKNESHVKIVGRYSYKNRQSQRPSEDCSITIRKSTSYDRGVWRCSNMADSTGNPVITSLNSSVNIEEMKILVDPESWSARRGANVTLDCKFNTQVNCVWNMNGISMSRDGHYVYNQNNGRETKDCSITLTNIKKVTHQGNWTCSSMVSHDFTKSVTSKMAMINVEDPKLVIQPPKQIQPNRHDRVHLSCKFDVAVNCRWTINGKLSRVDYLHNNGVLTDNCSIKMEDFNESYVGDWTCEDGEDHTIASGAVSLILGNPLEKMSYQCPCIQSCQCQLSRQRSIRGSENYDVKCNACQCNGSYSQNCQTHTSHVDHRVSRNDSWNSNMSLNCTEIEENEDLTLRCVASGFQMELRYGLGSIYAKSAKPSVGAIECTVCNASCSGYIAAVVILVIVALALLFLLLNVKYNRIKRLRQCFVDDPSHETQHTGKRIPEETQFVPSTESTRSDDYDEDAC